MFFVHSFIFPQLTSVFSGKSTSVFQRFSSATIHSIVRVLTPPVSSSFHNLLSSFLEILVFRPSIFQFPASLARISFLHQGSEFVLTSFHIPFVPTFSGLQQFINFRSHSLSRMARTFSAPDQNVSLPVHSSYHIMCSQMSLSFIFPNYLTSTSAQHIVLAFSCTCCFFHTSCTDTCWQQHSDRCTVSSLFLSTEVHFSFGCGLSSSQSFHASTKQ